MASEKTDEFFKVVMWAGTFIDDFAIGADASKEKGLKVLENMFKDMLKRTYFKPEELFEEIYGIYGFIPAIVGKMRGGVIRGLARLHSLLPFIYKIEPVRIVTTCLKDSVPLIHADKAYRRGFFGEGVKVGVVDSGVDPSCSLRGKVISYRNFVQEEEYCDYNGHGTHVAGIIAGDEEIYCGVAPKSKIISAKALNSEGEGYEDMIGSGIMWAYTEGAEIINLSLGTPRSKGGTPETFLSRLANELTTKGIVVIAAAGNEGEEGEGTIGSPGCMESVITVGAVDKHGRLASYSSRGPVDGIMKPDLVAPGGNGSSPEEHIISTRSQFSNLPYYPNRCHAPMIGTSMAAPHVSGSAALILEAMRKKGITVPNKHFFVKKVLMESATNLGYKRNEQGAGLVNIDKALNYIETCSSEEIVTRVLEENVSRVTESLASVLIPGAVVGISAVLLGAIFQPEKQGIQVLRTSYQEFYSQMDAILRMLEEKIHTLNRDYMRGVIPHHRYSEEMMKIARALQELNGLIKSIKNMG
ncbi:MAG: S8 family serine peptidase [Thermoproteota archaeon]